MSAETWQNLPKRAAEHPVLTGWVVLALSITLGIGVMHECRIGGDVLIVLVRDAKEELRALVGVAERLKKELTTWDLGDAEKSQPVKGSPLPATKSSPPS
jgi:hypothetical protein